MKESNNRVELILPGEYIDNEFSKLPTTREIVRQ